MNTNNTNFDTIEAYLFGQLPEAEKAAFEAQLAQNPELAQELKLQQAEHQAMQLLRRQEMRRQMEAWKAESANESITAPAAPTLKVSFKRVLQIAAAACALLLVGYFGFLRKPAFNTLEYADTMYPKAAVTTARGQGATPNQAIEQAKQAIQDKQYDQALAQLAAIPADNAEAEIVPLLQGDCYYFKRDYQQALSLFEAQQKAANEKIQQQAEYRTLMVWLAQGKQKEAPFQALLNKILNTQGHFNKAAAQELQQKLK